jgi:hypothetical protein
MKLFIFNWKPFKELTPLERLQRHMKYAWCCYFGGIAVVGMIAMAIYLFVIMSNQ